MYCLNNRVFLRLAARSIHTTAARCVFHVPDPKMGYRKDDKIPEGHVDRVKEGFQVLKKETNTFKEEMKEKMRADPKCVFDPGARSIVWKFDNPAPFNHFILTSDKDNSEGYSDGHFTPTANGTALFHGNLSLKFPKDGKVTKSGYCNIRCKRARKSFFRDDYYDWSIYTHLMLRVRGDGRPYLLNVSTAGYFDIMWHDIYNYVLHTRGGPYWQLTMIPFSKFFLSYMGRTQDKQNPLELHKITHFGITCCDRNEGPFRLEIDYIGLYYDPSHTEEFAYEMYASPYGIGGGA